MAIGPSLPPNQHLFQVYYDAESRASLSEGYIPLDNTSSNGKDDWFELWPIRTYLTSHALQDEAWYGFFSPRFPKKFGLDLSQISSILQQSEAGADVLLMSLGWDQIAFFLNPFEQGDFWTPGLMNTSQAFVDRARLGIDLDSLVSTSRTTVFSNFLAAKPVFWRRWLALADQLVVAADGGDSLAEALNQPTKYVKNGRPVLMKAFVQERLACLVLAEGAARVGTIDLSNAVPPDQTLFSPDPATTRKLQACASLKDQYVESKDPAYLQVFRKLRRTIPLTVSISSLS